MGSRGEQHVEANIAPAGTDIKIVVLRRQGTQAGESCSYPKIYSYIDRLYAKAPTIAISVAPPKTDRKACSLLLPCSVL